MKIVVVGSYGTGLSMLLARAPGAGETLFGTNFASGHGGKGSNQAVAAARLGATVELCTVVGTDGYGSTRSPAGRTKAFRPAWFTCSTARP
jgi:ribokinase